MGWRTVSFKHDIGDKVIIEPSEIPGIVRGMCFRPHGDETYLIRRLVNGEAKEEWERDIDIRPDSNGSVGFSVPG